MGACPKKMQHATGPKNPPNHSSAGRIVQAASLCLAIRDILKRRNSGEYVTSYSRNLLPVVDSFIDPIDLGLY